VGENIEKIFLEEIREKKKIGSGSFHMRGKGVKHGFSGALRTPYHFMKTKEKNKLSGEVQVSNMYETILPKKEFDLKDYDTKKTLLTRWRELYPNSKIMKEMGISGNNTLKRLIDDLDIPKKRNTGPKGPRRKAVAMATVEEKPTLLELALEPTPELEMEVEQPKAVLVTSGLHLEYNGEYNAEDLAKIFTKLQLIVDGEKNKFKISLSISECQK
jgi:hypothetical protein